MMSFDPDFQQAANATFEKLGIPVDAPPPRIPRGDFMTLRNQLEAFIPFVLSLDKNPYTEVEKTQYKIKASDGAEIAVVAYRKRDRTTPEPAILYVHGGGMVLGSAETFEIAIKADVAATGVAQFSVDYRLAPEHPFPTPVEDCYAALVWLSSNADSLGIDPRRIGVMGLSAGGGLAAATAILARDRKLNPPLTKQILLEPMLNDRNTVTDDEMIPFLSWTWDDNWTGWNALLGDKMGTDNVPAYAAPYRLQDASGLAPTFIDVGTLDIFAKEAEDYAQKLSRGGVDVDWHLYQGVPHGFELRGGGSKVVEQATTNRRRAMQAV